LPSPAKPKCQKYSETVVPSAVVVLVKVTGVMPAMISSSPNVKPGVMTEL
jgi:hypothetical protein